MQNTYLNGVDIKVEPFDMSYTGVLNKLDLLFYNNINRYGEILTSLIYNSGVKDSNNIDLIIYNPNKLFLNTDYELGYVLTGTSNRWKNNNLILNGLTNFKDNSITADHSAYSRFNVLTDYAIPYINGDYGYDGWYTLCSVVLPPLPTNSPAIFEGGFRHSNGTAQYANITGPSTEYHWNDLQNIMTDIDIYNFIHGGRYELYLSYNFVSTVKINSLNKTLLDNKLDNAWFKKVNILNPKLRTLETAIEFADYGKAQYIINSVSNSLLSLLI